MADKFYNNRLAVLELYVVRNFDVFRVNIDIKSSCHLEHCLFGGRICTAWDSMQFQGVFARILFEVVLLIPHAVDFFLLFPKFGKSNIQFLLYQLALNDRFPGPAGSSTLLSVVRSRCIFILDKTVTIWPWITTSISLISFTSEFVLVEEDSGEACGATAMFSGWFAWLAPS